MKKRVVILLVLCWAGIASAQNINRFEYFFDTDPGVGASPTFVNVSPTTLVTDLNIPVATASLAPGFHTLFIRSRNDLNQWTHTHFRNFFIADVPAPGSLNIDRVEYFIDTDPGVGLATAVTGLTPASVLTNFPIDISATPLTAGFHTFFVRARTTDGQWTHTHFRNFFVDAAAASPPTITSFSPTSANAGTIITLIGTNFSTTPANNIVSFNGIPATVTGSTATSITTILPPGNTSGTIRVNVGGLIATSSANFTTSAPNITALEYFFNTDPGPGNGTPISITVGTTIDLTNINIPTTSLPQGWHLLCVRAKDVNNVWGFYESRRIYIRENAIIVPPPVVEPITAMEFFYNTDNGPGTGTSIPVASGPTVDIVNNNLASTLPVGWHTVSVRAKNNANVWGFYETRRIYVRDAPPGPPPPASPIVAFEVFVDNDPGVGQCALTFTKPPATNFDLVDEPLNIGTVSLGAHKIGLRAKNQNGDWSMTELRNFTVTTPCTIVPPPTSANATRCTPGTLTLTASGAGGGQTYRWYPDNTTLTSLFQGNPFVTPTLTANTNYFVSVYDPTTFCESNRTQVTAIVTGIPKPALNLTGSLAVCAGNSVVLQAPAGFASYSWSNGLTTQSITLTATGVYSVVVGDGTCSSPSSDPFTFTVNPLPLKPTITATNGGSLCGTGSVTLSAPAGFTSYNWSSGQTTQNITVSSAGNFTVQVTDANNCQSPPADAFSVTTTPPAKPTISITGNTALCGGSTVTLSAPSGFSSYLWSNGSTAQNIIVNTAGNYSVTVANGACVSPASDPVAVTSVTIPPKPSITVTGNTALCIGSFAVLTATTAPVYLWSTGETTQQIVVSTAGSYTVQVGNTSNCLSVASNPASISLTGIACPGAIPTPSIVGGSTCGTGSATLTATGATGSQVYRWYSVPTGGSVLFIGANFSTPSISSTTTYYASIFDPAVPGEGSRAMGTATVVSFPTPTISPSGTVTVCAGSSTILSAPSGFTNYLWSNGATTQQISVSVAGNYSVQTGGGSCLSLPSTNVVVTIAPALTKPTVSVTGNTIFCGSGSVVLSAPSGFSSYAWSNGATTQSLTVTAVGSYTVAVSDGICTSPSSDAVTVTSVVVPPQPSITVTGSAALCIGAFAVLSAPAGFPNYLWSTGETTRQIVVTLAGNYTVQVGQAANCLSIASAATTITLTGTACGGGPTPPGQPLVTSASRCGSGSVTLTASGATGGQVYRWYDAPASGNLLFTGASYTTASLTNTTNFYATIFDSSTGEGSPAQATATIVTIATPTIAGPSSIAICTGGNTLLSAPTGFVQYLWSTGATTQQLSVTTAGSYSVRVGDGSCLSSPSNTIVVSLSPALSKPSVAVTGNLVFCGSGSVDLTAPVGFQYLWSTGATSRQITATATGNYSVVISNGTCTSPPSDDIIVTSVTQPTKPTVQITGATALCNNAFVALEAPAGFASYLWSNGETIRRIVVSSTAPGNYSVQVGAANSCLSVSSDPVTVTATGQPCGGTPPGQPLITNARRCGSGSVTLTASGATGGQVYRWYDAPVSGNLLFTGASYTIPFLTNSTNFYATIFDSSSGESSRAQGTATIVTFSTPVITGPSSIAICPGGNALLSAPTGFIQYVWSTGATTQQLSVTAAGNYSVQVGDGTCLSNPSNTVAVSVSSVLLKPSVAVNGNLVFCGSGSVDLTAPAGFQYLWSTGATSKQITITTTGSYSVVVSNGACISPPSDAVIVTSVAQPAKPVITVAGREFICAGAVVALTAPSNYTNYKWSNGETTQTILVDKTGLYSVQVGMSASCLSIASDVKEVKLGTVLQCGNTSSASNKAPVIRSFLFGVAIQSSIKYPLTDLISDDSDKIDFTSLRIVDQPSINGKASGGKASLDSDNNLILDYQGVSFAGKENITLQVCDLEGLCTQQIMVVDVVGDVVVFNGVTPNGDGINDFMRIQFIDVLENAKKNKVIIVNRWGEVVFEMEDYNNVDRVFTGNSSNGSELPAGTYLYKVGLASGKQYTGFLTLKK